MSKKCRAYSESRLGLAPTDNRKAFYAGWDAALRERLAQPEQEPVATVVARQYEDGTYAGNALDWAGRNCEDDLPIGTKLYTSQHPKQEQEPVAWRTKNAAPPGGYVVFQQYPQAVADLDGEIEPLYTAPQPRQWQGLTDEEYSQLHDGLYQQGKSLGWVVDQAEAKLREKNGGGV